MATSRWRTPPPVVEIQRTTSQRPMEYSGMAPITSCAISMLRRSWSRRGKATILRHGSRRLHKIPLEKPSTRHISRGARAREIHATGLIAVRDPAIRSGHRSPTRAVTNTLPPWPAGAVAEGTLTPLNSFTTATTYYGNAARASAGTGKHYDRHQRVPGAKFSTRSITTWKAGYITLTLIASVYSRSAAAALPQWAARARRQTRPATSVEERAASLFCRKGGTGHIHLFFFHGLLPWARRGLDQVGGTIPRGSPPPARHGASLISWRCGRPRVRPVQNVEVTPARRAERCCITF